MTEAVIPIRVIMGDGVENGPFRLSFNDDSEGYWWLTYDDGNVDWEVRFDDVAYSGCFFLEENGRTHMAINGLEEGLPDIYTVLYAIAARDADPEDLVDESEV